QDTLVLYDFEADPVKPQDLKGEETVSDEHKDSIEIVFRYPNTMERLAIRFFVNGKCPRKFSLSSSGIYMVLKQGIQSISVAGGIYKVRNPDANRFIIYYDPPDYPPFAEEKVKFISKCILRNDILQRIDCDGTVDPGFRLNKK